MTPQEMEQVLLYLVDKLDPQSKEEVGELLGGEVPDMGQDAMTKGGKAWDRLPERLKRRAAMSLKIKPAWRRTASGPRRPWNRSTACSRTRGGSSKP